MPQTFTFSTVNMIALVASPQPVFRLAFARARFLQGAVHPLRRS